MKRWYAALVRWPARQLHLAGGGLLLVLAAALWFYVLKAPLANLRALRAERAQLEENAVDLRPLSARLASLQAAVRDQERRLGASATPIAAQQVSLVGQINDLATAHGVALSAIRPAPLRQAMSFVQSGFDASASGRYASLLAWMEALEQARPDLAISSFNMQAGQGAGTIEMQVRVALYRLEGAP